MLGYKSAKQFLRVYAIILAVCILAFIVRLSKVNAFGWRLQFLIFFLTLVILPLFWETLRFINHYLNKVFPFDRNESLRIVIQLLVGGAIGLTIRFLIYLFGEPHLPFKLDELFAAATWLLFPLVTVAVNLGFFTSYFMDQWKDSLVKAERLEKEKSQVQFDNLKNQLNPHFLFNALTSLNSLIFEDQRLASEFLQQLAKVYRYVLQNKDRNFVSLKTELDFIGHYVGLLETRFHGAVKINFNIREDITERAIVPVTLQILIENAIKHNIADGSRKLVIDIGALDDYLVVSNNLQVRKIVETSNKQGLENLRTLYGFLTDKPVLIEPTPERFYVKVPLI
ncbi:MAG TPA: histidine kinase [Cyclobacteriaceae bacterium]|nr:histidine kinase [Cyclobacteriaceae bacterium]